MELNPTIAIINFAEKSEDTHPVVRAIFQKEKPENIDGLTWKLISKYFEADLQFCVFDGTTCDLDQLTPHKVEAFIYYFKSPSVLTSISDLVSQIQENFQPEMSALFYDGPSVSFDRKSDNVIEKITSEYFVEYITQDLS